MPGHHLRLVKIGSTCSCVPVPDRVVPVVGMKILHRLRDMPVRVIDGGVGIGMFRAMSTTNGCLLLAMNGSSNHLCATSAYPPTADIAAGMSVIVPISSAVPLKADVTAVGRESPKLTYCGLAGVL